MSDLTDRFTEVCGNCGFLFGSHSGSNYYSDIYEMFVPINYCPGHEYKMDWDKGPGTIFKSTGKYRKED